MTTVNYSFLTMFYNWIQFYQKLNLDLDMILIAEDDKAYGILQQFQHTYLNVHFPCSNITIERSELNIPNSTYNESYGWGEHKYIMMMSARPKLIREKLEEGRNIIFSDVDFIWRNNPLPYFANATAKVDLSSSHDEHRYHLFSSMDPWNRRCGGLWAMVSTEPTIRFVTSWQKRMEAKPGHNQKPYNTVLGNMQEPKVKDLQLSLDLFPHGKLLKQIIANDPTNKNGTVAVHFNAWTGFDGKKAAMVEYGFWVFEDNNAENNKTFPL
jgi:hypothetical protein